MVINMMIKDQTLVVNCKSITIKGVFFIAKVESLFRDGITETLLITYPNEKPHFSSRPNGHGTVV